MLDKVINSPSYVFGYDLDGKGGGSALTVDSDPARPYWIHLDYSGNDCYPLLEAAGLSAPVIESLTRIDTRPRSIAFEQGRLLILRAVNMNPGASPEDMVSVRFWWEKGRIISLRQRKILSTQDMKRQIEQGNGPEDLASLLFGIIEMLADRIADYVDSLEQTLEEYEAGIDTTSAVDMRRNVIEVRRHAAGVRRYLAPQRDALEAFSRHIRDTVSNDDMMYLHEQVDRLVRYIEDLDLVKEKAILLQDELMSRIAQEQNARMYVLSIIAAIFLPISFLTGLFGMNVAGLPGVDNPRGFIIVSLMMLGVTGGILLWLRSKRWL